MEPKSNKNLRLCEKEHQYYKTSRCPVCPICEREKKPTADFFMLLSAPARRALENAGITSLERLSAFSEKEILALHGMGPSSIPKLREALQTVGLTFKA